MTEAAKPKKPSSGRIKGSKNKPKVLFAKPAEPQGFGRPEIYSDELATELCNRLIAGKSLKKICEMVDMPSCTTVLRWLVDETKLDFQRQYARAREAQAEALFEEIFSIADDGTNDKYVDDQGNVKVDHDVIARSRLRVDTRRWAMSKMAPKRYADKIQQEVTGADGGPLEFTAITRRIVKAK
jgi:hypothetical protein